MEIMRQDQVRMERAHVHAWPALRAVAIEGWLWRSSGGGSQRANSVSTVDFSGEDVEAAIDTVEKRYRAVGAPVRFQTFDETSPAGLTEVLSRRGYRGGETTTTMFKRLQRGVGAADIEMRSAPWAEWLSVYLGEITENRQAVNRLILDRVPAPKAFFGCLRDGRVAATALCVVSHGCAVIECVTTRSDARRQGAALAVLARLEAWAATQDADWIGLQVVSTNAPAVALYERLGFVAGATNQYWMPE